MLLQQCNVNYTTIDPGSYLTSPIAINFVNAENLYNAITQFNIHKIWYTIDLTLTYKPRSAAYYGELYLGFGGFYNVQYQSYTDIDTCLIRDPYVSYGSTSQQQTKVYTKPQIDAVWVDYRRKDDGVYKFFMTSDESNTQGSASGISISKNNFLISRSNIEHGYTATVNTETNTKGTGFIQYKGIQANSTLTGTVKIYGSQI